MSNIYWSVFKNLERSVNDIAFYIHIDDSQLCVYSSKIIDIILRAAAEIESLSKELYKLHGGKNTKDTFKFDDVAIKYLNNLWMLDKKIVIISSPNCFQTNRVLMPFVKNEIRSSSSTGKMTYSWNNAYQNLKHDRVNSMAFGNLKYLFDILAALFVLNIYYKNAVIQLGKDKDGMSFPANMGSSIFSIEFVPLPHLGSNNPNFGYVKPDKFDSCIYYIDFSEDTEKIYKESVHKFSERISELCSNHPKVIGFAKQRGTTSDSKDNVPLHLLDRSDIESAIRQANKRISDFMGATRISSSSEHEFYLNCYRHSGFVVDFQTEQFRSCVMSDRIHHPFAFGDEREI